MMQFPLKQEGTVIGNEEIFPEGVNVEVVWVQDAGHLWMRVWERGCGETFACGTGACERWQTPCGRKNAVHPCW